MNPKTLFCSLLFLSTCVCAPTLRAQAPLEGLASYYADRFHLKPTSTGEKYNKNELVAASKTLPYGTRVEVTNVATDETVEVRINDCGPHRDDRILDLSRRAAEQISITKAGVAMVSLRVVELGTLGPTCHRAAWSKAKKRKAEQEKRRRAAAPATVSLGSGGAVLPPPAAPPAPTVYQRRDTIAPPPPPTVPGAPPTYGTEIPVAKGVPAAPTTAGPATYGSGAQVTPPQPAPVPASREVTAPTPPTEEFAPDEVLFGVQVGAYGKAENAARVARELTAAGTPYVQVVKVGSIHRVFAGKYYFQNQARELRDQLREAGQTGAAVRRIQ